tara:strand:- start:378 stop:1007 length:630 start_codon:yes stop_codon:yes gene_type:complete
MKNITKLIFIFNICFFHFLIAPSFGEIRLEDTGIELYLNSIKTMETDFIQISSNGELETGKLLIKKPGQMRFEYDAPSNHLVMASGILLVVIDKESTAEPQRYLTSQTPVGFLLDETIKLDINSNLKAIFFKESHFHVSLYNPKNPTQGELELVFSPKPIALQEWTITNYSGEKTRIILENVIINHPIDKKLFSIGREITKVKKELAKN